MSELYDRLKQGLNEADAYLSGEETGAKVHIPAEWDVKRIRTKLGMTQAAFAEAFGSQWTRCGIGRPDDASLRQRRVRI